MKKDLLYIKVITDQFKDRLDIPDQLKDEVMIMFQALPETESLESIYPDNSPKEILFLQRKLDSGELVLFTARVVVTIGECEGDTSLGCCLEGKYGDFVNGGSVIDMIETALKECLVDLRLRHTYNTDVLKLNEIVWEVII